MVQIYSYFYRNTVRVGNLKDICENSNEEYHKLTGYSKTRFIGLAGCAEKILKMFHHLKTFFINSKEENIPVSIIRFFNNPLSKLILIFVRDQAKTVEASIKSVESQKISGFEAWRDINSLKNSIKTKLDLEFTSSEFKMELELVKKALPFNDIVYDKKGKPANITVNEHFIKKMVVSFQGKN